MASDILDPEVDDEPPFLRIKMRYVRRAHTVRGNCIRVARTSEACDDGGGKSGWGLRFRR